MSVVATIIAGLFSTAGTGLMAGLQSEENRRARAEARELADIRRGDVLAAEKEAVGLRQEELGEKRRQFDLDMKLKKERDAYDNRIGAVKRFAQDLNNNLAMRDRFIKIWS